ncbi:DUF3592 domain-containing protein [Actinokineospora sp. NPDC004072]
MSEPDAVEPADERAMFIVGAVLVTLATGYAAFRICIVTQGSSFPGFWFGTEVAAAFMVSFLGGGFMVVADRVEQDRSVLPAFALLLVGAAGGVAVAGLASDVPLFVAGVLLLAGLGLLLIHWLRRRRTARLLSHGRRADATFIEVEKSSGDNDSFYVERKYTLAFTGEDGERRTVAGKATFPAGNAPKPGEPVTVWYDPRKPTKHVIRRGEAEQG